VATMLARFTLTACPALRAVHGKHCTTADAVCAVSTGRRIAPLFLCERLRLGAGWCNAPSPVLRGAGDEPSHGRDIVAPPGNQAATENTNFCLNDGENPAYSPGRILVRSNELWEKEDRTELISAGREKEFNPKKSERRLLISRYRSPCRQKPREARALGALLFRHGGTLISSGAVRPSPEARVG
jgi:hypothetical protein